MSFNIVFPVYVLAWYYMGFLSDEKLLKIIGFIQLLLNTIFFENFLKTHFSTQGDKNVNYSVFLKYFLNFELGFHVAKDGLKLATQSKMTLNFQSSYSTSLVLRCQACTTIPGFERSLLSHS